MPVAFSEMLARIGIGSANVDTQLEKREYHPGEVIQGEIVIQGGNVPQSIDDVYLYLVVSVQTTEGTKNYTWGRTRLAQGWEIEAGDVRQIPFSWQLPFDLPISGNRFRTFLRTGLEIEHALDPTDSDEMNIILHPKAQAVQESLNRLGFHLVERDAEESHKYGSSRPFVMEYEFKPYGSYRTFLDEVEVTYREEQGDLGVSLIADQKPTDLIGAISESLGIDDRLVHFAVTDDDYQNPEQLDEKIRLLLDRYC